MPWAATSSRRGSGPTSTVPIGASAQAAHKLVEGSQLKVYAGGDHGLPTSQKDRVNADLLAFLQSRAAS